MSATFLTSTIDEMPEPFLDPKFTKSVAFVRVTDFQYITTEKRQNLNNPFQKPEK